MIKLKSLLTEAKKLNPLMTFRELKGFGYITAYHASESPNFIPSNDTPLHIGSIHQSVSLIKNMKRSFQRKFYLYEVTATLGKMPNFLFNEDPHIEELGSNKKYDSYAYSNRIEYPAGLRQGNNISIVLSHPKEQITDIKLVKEYD